MRSSLYSQNLLSPFIQLKFPAGVALFLDIDGTLLEIAEKPESVDVPEGLKQVLNDLENCLDGALAFVSGRSISDVDRLFEPLKLPTSGKHGLERRDSFRKIHQGRFRNSKDFTNIKKVLKTFAIKNPGTVLEDKGKTIALHYRLKPNAGSHAKKLISNLNIDQNDLEVLSGKMVLEVKPRVFNKGTAISKFMMEYPFIGRIPIFIGDDVSDEAGFKTVNARGGVSICVNPEIKSAARWKVANVSSVLNILTTFSARMKKIKTGYRL